MALSRSRFDWLVGIMCATAYLAGVTALVGYVIGLISDMPYAKSLSLFLELGIFFLLVSGVLFLNRKLIAKKWIGKRWVWATRAAVGYIWVLGILGFIWVYIIIEGGSPNEGSFIIGISLLSVGFLITGTLLYLRKKPGWYAAIIFFLFSTAYSAGIIDSFNPREAADQFIENLRKNNPEDFNFVVFVLVVAIMYYYFFFFLFVLISSLIILTVLTLPGVLSSFGIRRDIFAKPLDTIG